MRIKQILILEVFFLKDGKQKQKIKEDNLNSEIKQDLANNYKSQVSVESSCITPSKSDKQKHISVKMESHDSSSASYSQTTQRCAKRPRIIASGNDLLSDVIESYSYVKGASLFTPSQHPTFSNGSGDSGGPSCQFRANETLTAGFMNGDIQQMSNMSRNMNRNIDHSLNFKGYVDRAAGLEYQAPSFSQQYHQMQPRTTADRYQQIQPVSRSASDDRQFHPSHQSITPDLRQYHQMQTTSSAAIWNPMPSGNGSTLAGGMYPSSQETCQSPRRMPTSNTYKVTEQRWSERNSRTQWNFVGDVGSPNSSGMKSNQVHRSNSTPVLTPQEQQNTLTDANLSYSCNLPQSPHIVKLNQSQRQTSNNSGSQNASEYFNNNVIPPSPNKTSSVQWQNNPNTTPMTQFPDTVSYPMTPKSSKGIQSFRNSVSHQKLIFNQQQPPVNTGGYGAMPVQPKDFDISCGPEPCTMKLESVNYYQPMSDGQRVSFSEQAFLRRLIGEESAPYRSHPLFPLLRDLIIADMNFSTEGFPFYTLFARLPKEFDHLLHNYMSRNANISYYHSDPSIQTVVMDALKCAHSMLMGMSINCNFSLNLSKISLAFSNLN